MAASSQLFGAVVLGVAVGYGVDAWLGTKPYGLAVGGLGGSALGLVAFMMTTMKLLNSKERKP